MKRYAKSGMSLLTEMPDGDWIRHSDHEAALAAAVAQEREACAAFADARPKWNGCAIAEVLRARS